MPNVDTTYQPLTERVPESTTQEQRIEHLQLYFRACLAERPPELWSDFDFDIMRILSELKLRYRAVEHLS